MLYLLPCRQFGNCQCIISLDTFVILKFIGNWTAVRVAHSPKQFLWDNGKVYISASMKWFDNGTLDTLSHDQLMICDTFRINAFNESVIRIDCRKDIGHVICEHLLE